MKLLTVLAATAAAAAVAAALSIPAGADRSAGDKATKLATCLHAHVKACEPGSAAPTELVSCLRAHGLNPPDNVFQLKPWIARQAGSDAGKAALNACGVDVNPPQSAPADKDLAACLRAHGADVPAGADGLALKTWIGDHSGDAKVMDALKLCAGGPAKAPAKAKDCGGGAATPARKPDGSAKPTL